MFADGKECRQLISFTQENFTQLLVSERPETPIRGSFLVRNQKMRFSNSFIFRGLLPSKMAALPCATLVSVLSGRKLANPKTTIRCFVSCWSASNADCPYRQPRSRYSAERTDIGWFGSAQVKGTIAGQIRLSYDAAMTSQPIASVVQSTNNDENVDSAVSLCISKDYFDPRYRDPA